MAKSQRLISPVILLSVLTIACSSSAPLPKNSVTAEPTADVQQYEISEITYELDVNWGIKETDKIIRARTAPQITLRILGPLCEDIAALLTPDRKARFTGH